jgi:tetratricopeptide (TPR) repeat protein
MVSSGIHTGSITTDGGHAIVGNDNQIIQNFYHSASYQAMESQRQKLLERIQKYPDDSDFQQELARLLQQMEDFKRDVLKLAEDFQRIPLNTERLKLAKQHFDVGEYVQARAVLDAESITQEQDALLAEQQRLQEKQATITAQLDDKANEWLLKASLTSIDYSLGDQRIAHTSGYFEKALKSGRTPDRLFGYAKFLQENNQYHKAETFYIEALKQSITQTTKNYVVIGIMNHLGMLVATDNRRMDEAELLYTKALEMTRTLAQDYPTIFLPRVAGILNNLGILVATDGQRGNEAKKLYTEALDILRKLEKYKPMKFLPEIAMTLNNLGAVVRDENHRHNEAEKLYTEALMSYRILAQNNPRVFLPSVAMTLNNLALSVMTNRLRHSAAEKLFIEALRVRRTLAKDNPAVYLPYVAATLNNLGILLGNDNQRRKEAETLYNEALTIRRLLAKDNPAVYLPDVAMTLHNLGILMRNDNQRRKEAETLCADALTSYHQLAKDNPAVYLPYVAHVLWGFGEAYLNWNEPDQALPLLRESVKLLAPLAQQTPSVFGKKHDAVLQLIEQAKAANG